MRRFAFFMLLLGGCAFSPDLSRFPLCGKAGECPEGSSCLLEERRCVPNCGEQCEDAGPVDAGVADDAGVDAGGDAGADAGVDAGVDAGLDAGVDAGPELALAATTLPPAIETRAYSFTFMPTGGDGGYFFALDGGVPGFTLSTSGELSTSSAPTAGTFGFSVTVRDGTNAQVTTGFSLEVRPFLRVANGALVEGRQGQAYSQQLSATGGTPPYTWVVDGGMPPAGLTLDGSGLLQGAPTMTATSGVSFGVTVSDSAEPPQSASRIVTVTTRLLDLSLAIATRAAADGRVGTPYSQPLKSYAGSAPIMWTIQTGSASLPPGLALTNAGANWQIVGTPSDAGTFAFTVNASDSLLANQMQDLSITVY